MSHAKVQDYLYGRYSLTPAMLYSIIRLSRDGATYDLPVEGDWLTIAVVAERGEVKISGTKNTSKNDDDDDGDDDEDEVGDNGTRPPKEAKKTFGSKDPKQGKGAKSDDYNRKRKPRKYVNLKLCSLPPRSKNGSSASGDALLQLLLFEADSVSHGESLDEDGKKVHIKRYSGGSGGAYEQWCNLTVGSVIAILNPKILRPLRVSPYSGLRGLGTWLTVVGWISGSTPFDATSCSQPV
jgi:minichromosome maintenance protein 10